MDPVTFSSPSSYIPIYVWKDYPKLYSFTIEFQTTENNGVLAYVLGAENNNLIKNKKRQNLKNQNSQSTKITPSSINQHFFALEIHNRFLYAYFSLGGNDYIRHRIVNDHVSSGKSHQIYVEIQDRLIYFKFDQKTESQVKLDSLLLFASYQQATLELKGPFIIGGLYPNHTTHNESQFLFTNPSKKLPPYFYSGMLGHGYVGCIQDVEINGHPINLTKFAAHEYVSGISTEMCAAMSNQCDIGHCMNDGVCMEGWNRFCDCSATGFNGPICNQRKLILIFF
jgi:leucine-rich repeat transmembrane neuronal protein 1/2